ncbi:MAG: ATP-binding cassette domain-containing protein, partial [Woeseiaceae bacterium]
MTEATTENPESVPAPVMGSGDNDPVSKDFVLPAYAGQHTELGEKTVGNVTCDEPFMIAEDVNVYYGDNHAIQHVSLEIGKKEVIALIGPSGCGKSTFLRCLNRMNDSIETAR